MSAAATLALPDAAAHMAMSPRAFAREVREGRLPAALPVKCRPRIWSRAALDTWLEAQGRGPSAQRRAGLLERIDGIGG